MAKIKLSMQKTANKRNFYVYFDAHIIIYHIENDDNNHHMFMDLEEAFCVGMQTFW